MTITIDICGTCAKTDHEPEGKVIVEQLTELVARDPDLGDVVVRNAACMLVCGEPISVSLSGPEKVSYLFSDVKVEDVQNLITLLHMYKANRTGLISDARPLGRLRFCLKGRLPA